MVPAGMVIYNIHIRRPSGANEMLNLPYSDHGAGQPFTKRSNELLTFGSKSLGARVSVVHFNEILLLSILNFPYFAFNNQ